MSDNNDTTIDIDGAEILAPLTQEVSPAIAAEINQQVATAHRFKRGDIKTISEEIASWATLNEETASECMYSLERGGKAITGPSIRFAEIVRSAYRNMRVAARFVRLDLDDMQRGAVIVEAVALDLERNQAEVIPVRRSVMTSAKGGRKAQVYSADMINMTVNAASSLARRNAILAVVPKAFWITGYQRVVKVLQGDASTLNERRVKIFEAFGRINVAPERVLAALGVKSVSDITPEHMPQLVGFMTAIKDGESPDSVFQRTTTDGTPQPTHATVNNPLRDQADDGSPTDPKTGEITSTGKTAEGAKPAAETTTKTEAAASDVGQSERGATPDTMEAAATVRGNTAEKPAEVVEDGKVPATADEYRVHTLAWIAATPDLAERRKRWAAERQTRTSCKLPEEILVELSTALAKPAPVAA